jgi:SH3 domain-containing YSC84-like protein 1
MNRGSRANFVLCACLLLSFAVIGNSQTNKSKSQPKNVSSTTATAEQPLPRGKKLKEGSSQAEKSAKVFGEIMGTPDKGIPTDLLNKAECVAVFPSVIKGGFIVGAKAGRGVASCRTSAGWSAPAFFELKGGSVGLQVGGSATDLVLLFMNTEGLKKLINSKVELGGDASVAAGPVGREASAATDASMNAEILSYSRAKGLFAGVSLKGTVISPEKSDMEGTYGSGVTALQVLETSNTRAPSEVQVFPNKLGQFSSRTK